MVNTAPTTTSGFSPNRHGTLFSQRVMGLIDSSQDIPDAQNLAHQLNIAQSTLQRRLKREGTSYQQLKNDYRFNLAKYYLRHTSNNAAEIAYLIGFKETDAFYKNFKRWTGQTPGEFRAAYKELSSR